ncbi:ribosome small subunit-dependent GTPase A [Clostridium sp. YIM B02515]|uniref:Small ribosomal subunit biogenesis GTPase RsgA n=1 Tax=Clostridium rhizosphaerae TaxID=2803861 RepID=A0ABS1T6Q6_9CLOT|nr:ribosome small subunit-dependent GTPase A [Clostridium rhizosphaerae]MBL4934946.1 ribosome small subunit-dependent GTPase A [Clostridium rhizosphaerae]
MQGTIIKGIAGFYYVKIDNDIIECKARGRFRLDELTPMVGDRVEISVKNNKGVIEKIYERSSELIRPAVSNVTQAFIIFTFKNPDLNSDLLNKFLMICEYHNLKIVVCFNKIDLVDIDEYMKIVNMLRKAEYEIMLINAKSGEGIEELKRHLSNNITVFCGPSGVGKSTILNQLIGNDLMKTGDISAKLGRGKHTTRHSELVDFNDGFIVDTPGFTSLDTLFIPRDEIQFYFPEFRELIGQCRFTGCIHYKEPNCAIKEAVDENEIDKERYDFYVKCIEEAPDGRNKR